MPLTISSTPSIQKLNGPPAISPDAGVITSVVKLSSSEQLAINNKSIKIDKSL